MSFYMTMMCATSMFFIVLNLQQFKKVGSWSMVAQMKDMAGQMLGSEPKWKSGAPSEQQAMLYTMMSSVLLGVAWPVSLAVLFFYYGNKRN